METTTPTTPTTANRRAPRDEDRVPQLRCPHCRTANPTIVYGQWTWTTQHYEPVEDDWAASETYWDSQTTTGAVCNHCDGDLTEYLIRRDSRTPGGFQGLSDWFQGLSDFAHDVEVPRRLPMPRNNRRTLLAGIEWTHGKRWQGTHNQPLDWELQKAIDEHTDRLGRLLDERAARRARGTWKEGEQP